MRPSIKGFIALAPLALGLSAGASPPVQVRSQDVLVEGGFQEPEVRGRSTQVVYGDLDLGGAGGVGELQNRVRHAISKVCGADYFEHKNFPVLKRCMDATTNRTAIQINTLLADTRSGEAPRFANALTITASSR